MAHEFIAAFILICRCIVQAEIIYSLKMCETVWGMCELEMSE